MIPLGRILLAEAQLLDELLVPAEILFLEVFEKTFPLPDQFQEAGPGTKILFMGGEMFDEMIDSFRQ